MKDFPVQIHFPVHWGDMDALGHVNHTRYIAWFETARCTLFQRVGLVSVGKPEIGPILVHVQANYRAPVHHPAQLIVGCRVSRFGNTSFELEYQLVAAARPGQILADGSTIIVLIDYQTGRKVPIPSWFRAAVEALPPARLGAVDPSPT